MDLHLVLFHPEEKKVEKEDCTLEEKVEGDHEKEKMEKKVADNVCQLCDLPLPPPLSLADHLLAEHDVSIPLLLLLLDGK